jgi:hypothetical protein
LRWASFCQLSEECGHLVAGDLNGGSVGP